MQVNHRVLRSLAFVAISLVAVLSPGCARQAVPVFVGGEELEGLPDSHRQQINETLAQYFGNPVNPRLALPDVDDPEVLVDIVDPDRLQHGAEVFNRRCAGCHGITGDGNGEAAPYLQPKPRDYRNGIYKFTSTPYGAKPSRKDLVRIVRRGAKGTSMPSFPFLPDEEVRDVVEYVIMLSYRGDLEAKISQIAELDYDAEDPIDPLDFADTVASIHDQWEQAKYQIVLPVTARPKYDDTSIKAGRQAFLSEGCVKCHGQEFRGQTEWLSKEFLAALEQKPEGEREQINYDAWGNPAPAADLTARMLHGGRRPIDIYRRIYTGINGTPMPAFDQSLADEPETIWHLVHYVLSVVEEREVEGLDEVTAVPNTASAEGN